VGDFDALAGASKEYRVVAHNVATPDGGESNARWVALAGHALAGIDRAVVEITAQRLRDDLAHLERGARRGVDLVPVVRLNNFNVVPGVQRLGCQCQELQGDVHTHTACWGPS